MRYVFQAALALFLAAVMLAPQAMAQGSYRIQPGDTLDVTVLEDEALNRQVLVGPDGRISLPLAGTVRAGGQTIEAVEASIADKLAPNFAVKPNIFVALSALAPPPEPGAAAATGDTIDVYVLGQVNTPGRMELEPGTSLLQAIAAAGGVDRFAATKRIQLRRTIAGGQEQMYLFNYRDVERGGRITSSLTLRQGDVIVVPERRLFE